MRIVSISRRRWGCHYGDTHRGFVVRLFGVPVFRRKVRL